MLISLYQQDTEAAKAKALADVSTVLARQKSVEEYVKEFESAKTQIKEVAQKIDTITNIWQTVLNICNARFANGS